MLLIMQSIRRFVYLYPAFCCSFLVAQPSAVAQYCARQLNSFVSSSTTSLTLATTVSDDCRIVIHNGAQISLETFTQPYSLGHGNCEESA